MDFFEAQDRARRRTGRLVVLFALALLGTILGLYLAALFITGFATGEPFTTWWEPRILLGVTAGTLLVCGGASFSRWLALRDGGPAVAERVGGRRVATDTTDLRERMLLNVVEEMSLASGVPTPAVYVLRESSINAFAAGYSPADAAIAVTDGALDRLTREELQGVVAHEFSHILNGDMRLNTRLTSLVYGILALSLLGRLIFHAATRIRVTTSARRKGDNLPVIALLLVIGLALLVIGYLGHVFGRLIQAAVSRQREFLADSSAVQFTRNPAGIAGALKKLGGLAIGGWMDADHAGEISHFCFAQNFRSGFAGLFSTHPDLSTRIRAIDPGWDGKFVVSKRASTPPPPPGASGPSASAFAAAASHTSPSHPGQGLRTIDPATLIGAAGQLTPGAVQAGGELLRVLPDSLRDAVHDPHRVTALCLALSLPAHEAEAADETILRIIATHSDEPTARLVASLHADLAHFPEGQHLALVQLAAPTLRQFSPAQAATLANTLDAVVHADGRLTVREFALQKLVARTLGLASNPRDAIHVLAPNQVVSELSIALSAAARIDADDEAAAQRAFDRAAVEFNGLQPPLAYRPAAQRAWDDLDLALEHLAHTPAAFRKRVLRAFATALTADSRLTHTEADLLRAFAAVLDCPLPPVLPVSA